ncbi:MAG: 4Fe-4S binding protein [Treponema sp.]|nr:4Fe-4S binding protein [Spirochaetia bacterium]MDD7459497.1 4Fe-4S binding protein [Spirochaetales bacterium]MDY5811007.1 4Fe-4S binding protein [Treponema sp.]MEE1182845.1 4Fe-4S binding protein [Treponema sp.]
MAYKINPDACINCGACEGECPTGSISEANDKRVINADSCVSCGACAGACPSEAISEE